MRILGIDVETIDPVTVAIETITVMIDNEAMMTAVAALIATSAGKKVTWREIVPTKTQDLIKDVVATELVMEHVTTVGSKGICLMNVLSLLASKSKDEKVVVVAALSS